MSKRNQQRALTLQEKLAHAVLREQCLAEIIYSLLPKNSAHGIITAVFAAVQQSQPGDDLKQVIHQAIEDFEKASTPQTDTL